MRCQVNTKRTVFLWPCLLLVSSTVGVFADGPVNESPARACVRLDSRSSAFGPLGCTKMVYLRNACDLPVVAEVGRTQRLFSGNLSEAFPIVVPAGGELSLGCSWWSGAMAPVELRLLAARYLQASRRHGARYGSDRR